MSLRIHLVCTLLSCKTFRSVVTIFPFLLLFRPLSSQWYDACAGLRKLESWPQLLKSPFIVEPLRHLTSQSLGEM